MPDPTGVLPPTVSGLPAFDIVRSTYAELVVTDLERARWFWADVVGLIETAADDDAVYLRGCEELSHHNLVLRRGPRPGLSHLGFRVRHPDDLGRAEAYFSARGCRTEWRAKGSYHGLGETVRVEDPLGFVAEFCYEMERVERLTQRYDLRHGAEPARLDHFNLVVPDVPEAYRYYRELGFGLSETIEDDSTLYAAWMFRKQTVHDVAFTGGAGPRLHHLGFFAHESANVLRVCDVLGSINQEAHVERGPGRHGVSNAFYVYLRDPDGHRLEIYTSDYFTGDPDHEPVRWDVQDPRRRDFWGGPVVRSWYEEASDVFDLDGMPRLVRALRQPSELEVGADGIGARPSIGIQRLAAAD